MDFGRQVHAARVLKGGVSREDLAAMAGVHVNTIIKLENGGAFSDATRRKVIYALQRYGVALTDRGAEIATLPVEVIDGANRLALFLDDVERCSDFLWINGADERLMSEAQVADVDRMRGNGLSMKHMVCEGDTFLRGPLSEYRWVPKENFTNQVRYLYGDTLAIGERDEFILIRSAATAEAERRQYLLLWKLLEQPPRSTCEVRYAV